MPFNTIRSFLGGFELNKIKTHWPYLIVYFILYVFYSVYFFIPKLQTRYFPLIGCGSLLSAILIFKLVLLFIRFLTRFAVHEKDEVRPTNIPPEIWRHKTFLINSRSDIDSAVNDLIISGVDSGKLLELVDYLNDTNQMGGNAQRNDNDEAEPENSHKNKLRIQIGKSIHTLPFSLHQIDQINFSTPSFVCILFSVVFGFCSSYLSISLVSQFKKHEKCFLSFVMASSTFSIILPPAIDPYNMTINDPWNSFTRPFLITIICLAWRLILRFLCKSHTSLDSCITNETVIHQIYSIKIEWNLFLPYIFIALKYGLFFTLAMFLGFYGHPVSSFVSLFESCSRYFLGQNGFGGLLHMTVQLLRGAASVAAIWGLFQIKNPSNTSNFILLTDDSQTLVYCSKFRTEMICYSIAVSTFINVFPIMLNRFLIKHWASTFCYPFLAAALSLAFPLLFVATIDSNYDVIKWFCFSWLTLFELVFPYLYSAHQYFICHFLILPQIPFIPIIRYISSLIVSPLFLSHSLRIMNKDHPLNDLVIAFIITHSVQKIHSETHIFALAAFFSVLSLPFDFGKKDPAVNLFISLLVASKVESFLPVLKIVQNNRNYQLVADAFFDLSEFPYIARYIIMKIINNALILVDVVIKIPSLFWCFFTGGGIGPIFGCPYFLVSQPIRPNYFFDWPKNLNVYQNVYKDSVNKEGVRTPTSMLTILFEKNINEHPVETPVYMSAVRAVAKSLGPLIRSGRLGHVNANNIFLFKSTSNNAAFFLHVISIEPTCFRFQLRGLEYKSQTLCHEGEEMNLNEIVNNYDFSSLNIHAAFHSATCDYDLRLHAVEMLMYDVSTTLLSQAFIGIEGEQCITWFIYSFAFSLRNFAYDETNNNDNHSSSMNLSANEDLIPAGERIASLVEMLNTRFRTCPDQINDYKIIIDSKNLFNKVIDFFLTTDSNGTRNNQGLNLLIPFRDGPLSDALDILFNLFACIIMCVFDKSGHIIVHNVAKNFGGKDFVTNEWDQDLISSLDPKIRDFVLQFVRESYIACYLASASILDANQNESDGLPSDETMADVMSQLIENDKESVISPINSQRFASEFTLGDKKLYAIAGEKILYFCLQNTQWSVFQVNHEYVRGIWSQESKDILFFENEDSERISIQENIYFLNNLIIQSCDSPIGYPAYCSEIFEAYANPLMKGNLILH